MILKLFLWFLYGLFLIISLDTGRRILRRDQPTTKEGAPGAGNTAQLLESPGTARFMKSLSHRDDAVRLHSSERKSEAFGELDQAEIMLQSIRNDFPEFHPEQLKARLEECARLREEWQKSTAVEASPLPPALAPEPSAADEKKVPQVGAVSTPETALPSLKKEEKNENLIEKSAHPINQALFGTAETASAPVVTVIADKIPAGPENVEVRPDRPEIATAEKEESPLGEVASNGDEIRETPASGGFHGDPTMLWFRAYTLAEMAKELEDRGEKRLALQKYEESKRWYEILETDFPDFQSVIVQQRKETLTAKLEELKRNAEPQLGERVEGE